MMPFPTLRTAGPAGDRPGVSDPGLRLALTATAAKLLLMVAFAVNTRFVMDEFAQLGAAKYLQNGLFETIWPEKTVLYLVFYKLAHLVGWDSVSILLTGRVQTALLGCATIAMVYLLARAIGERPARALVCVLFLLCFSTFIERIFRTRSEPLALFFATAALLVIVRGSADGLRRLLWAGVLGGLAFLTTQKSIYFNVALGVGLLAEAAAGRRFAAGLRRGTLLVAGWCIPVAVYCLVFGGADPVRVLRGIFVGPIEVATTGQTYYDDLRVFVWQTLLRNLPLYAAAGVGIVATLRAFGRIDAPRRIALVFTIVMAALIFSHNQPWPYVFIMVLPFLALWGPASYDAAGRPWLRRALLGLFAAVVALSFARNAKYLAHDNTEQLAVIATAERLIGPGQSYFDGVYMLPNRNEIPGTWLDARGVQRTLTEGKDSHVFRALTAAPPGLVILNYRTSDIEPVLRGFIENRYLAVSPNIMLPGRRIPPGAEVAFDVPVAGSYGLYASTGAPVDGEIRIDGIVRMLPVELAAGVHGIDAGPGDDPLFMLPAGLAPGPLGDQAPPRDVFADIYSF